MDEYEKKLNAKTYTELVVMWMKEQQESNHNMSTRLRLLENGMLNKKINSDDELYKFKQQILDMAVRLRILEGRALNE